MTQACARSSLCLGYYITGLSALSLDHALITPPARGVPSASSDTLIHEWVARDDFGDERLHVEAVFGDGFH